MVESKWFVVVCALLFVTMSAAGFEKGVGASNVGLNEVAWSVDRAIDVRLGCEMHNAVWLVLAKNGCDGCAIANVRLNEGKVIVIGGVLQRR